MKNIFKVFLLSLVILPCSLIFAGCSNKVTEVSVENPKIVFSIGEDFSLGEGKVKQKINEEWSFVEQDSFVIDSSSYDKNQKGIYEIKVSVEEINYSYNVLVIDELQATYGQTLQDIEIGITGLSFKDALTTSVGNVGTKNFTIVYKQNAEDAGEEFVISVLVNKASPSYTIPAGLNGYYGQKLKDITLPEGFSWKNEETLLDEIGEKSFKVIFTPADLNNYNTIEIAVSVNVAKLINSWTEPLTMSNFVYGQTNVNASAVSKYGTVNYTFYADYNGQAGASLASKPTNAGVYWVCASVEEGEFYEALISQKIRFEITKATPSYTVPTNLTATVGQTLAEISLPQGFAWKNPQTSVGEAGDNSFEVIFTPNDTNNFNSVEVLITITVSSPAISWPTEKLEELGIVDTQAPVGEISSVTEGGDSFCKTLTIEVTACTNFEEFVQSVFNAGLNSIYDEEFGEDMPAASYQNCITTSSNQSVFSASNGSGLSAVITYTIESQELSIVFSKII